MSIWPSLTSRTSPKVSAWQNWTFVGAQMCPAVAPDGCRGFWEVPGRTGCPEQDLGCSEANSLLRAAPGILQDPNCSGGRMWPWVCSEMFYSGCLSSKEHFPLRLNYLDSVYSKHRRQDSSISSFRKYGWVVFPTKFIKNSGKGLCGSLRFQSFLP